MNVSSTIVERTDALFRKRGRGLGLNAIMCSGVAASAFFILNSDSLRLWNCLQSPDNV